MILRIDFVFNVQSPTSSQQSQSHHCFWNAERHWFLPPNVSPQFSLPPPSWTLRLRPAGTSRRNHSKCLQLSRRKWESPASQDAARPRRRSTSRRSLSCSLWSRHRLHPDLSWSTAMRWAPWCTRLIAWHLKRWFRSLDMRTSHCIFEGRVSQHVHRFILHGRKLRI